MFSGQTQPAPWAETIREYTQILQTQEHTNMKLILLIYSKRSMNECNQAVWIACYCFPKKFWKYIRVVWHVSALLSFRKCQQTRRTAFVKQAKHGETSWALEQVDYSWIQMIWNGSQALLQMTSRWAPSHSSTRLRHEHAWTVHPGKEIALFASAASIIKFGEAMSAEFAAIV